MLIHTLFSLFLFPTLLQMCILKKFGRSDMGARPPPPLLCFPKQFWNLNPVTRSCARLDSWKKSGTWSWGQPKTRGNSIFSANFGFFPPPPQHNKNTTQHDNDGATFRPLTTQRYGPVITSTAAIFRGKSSDRQRSEGSSYLKAIAAQRRGKILWRWPTNLCISHNNTHQR